VLKSIVEVDYREGQQQVVEEGDVEEDLEVEGIPRALDRIMDVDVVAKGIYIVGEILVIPVKDLRFMR
jgi:hypothetical protein